MFTYVINTSENKTFDSDRLFDLAGYNKISWMNCSLNELGNCAKEILNRQNVLVAEEFCVAVIVDFFGFDRIRAPYGRNGFGKENGVDLSLYTPYIEAYITDNIIAYLEKYELFAKKYEVYYVQSEKYEKYSNLDNAKEQLKLILSGKSEAAEAIRAPIDDIVNARTKDAASDKSLEREKKDELFAQIKAETEQEYTPYKTFTLYCTPHVSLDFNIADYPYGTPEQSLTFDDFYAAFGERKGVRQVIKRHYYLTTYGGGSARAAFDTLSLSLYLVYIYEREEEINDEGELEIAHLDTTALRDVLETAWSKLAVARNIAAENQSNYFSLNQNQGEITSDLERRESKSVEYSLQEEKNALKEDVKANKLSADSMYREILRYAGKADFEIDAERRREFDALMEAYLQKRDSTCEKSVEADIDELKKIGALKMTKQCPSKENYDYAVSQKEQEISNLFEEVLAADYIDVDYTEEKETADEAYREYNNVKACMTKNFLGDLIFLAISVFIMFLPYQILQLAHSSSFSFSISVLRTAAIAAFAGLFVLSFAIHLFIFGRKLKKLKDIIKNCYIDCLAKERYSFSKLRRRYESDLIRIEEARYEIRQITHLYEANIKKDKNVTLHRNMLEEMQDKVSSMLNNLEVEPVVDPYESVFGEFDLNKSLRAKDNKIYQIFSIETIEKLFCKKGSDRQ